VHLISKIFLDHFTIFFQLKQQQQQQQQQLQPLPFSQDMREESGFTQLLMKDNTG